MSHCDIKKVLLQEKKWAIKEASKQNEKKKMEKKPKYTMKSYVTENKVLV